MWCVGVGKVDVACDLQLDVCMVCGVSGLEMWTWRVTCVHGMWCVGVGNVDVACDLQLDVCIVCGVSGLGGV